MIVARGAEASRRPGAEIGSWLRTLLETVRGWRYSPNMCSPIASSTQPPRTERRLTEEERVDLVKDLTKRQKEIFDFIGSYAAKHGYPPTVREIGKAVGLHSSSTVHAHLAKLEKLGRAAARPVQAARDRGAGRAGEEGRSGPAGPAAGRPGRRRRADPGRGEHRGLPRGSRRDRRRGRRLHPPGARREHEGRRHPRGRLRRRAPRRATPTTARSSSP